MVSTFAYCLRTLAGAATELATWSILQAANSKVSMIICECLGLTDPSLSPAMLSSPNTGLQNPMSSVGVGQPSAPTINTSAPIDPSSMQRAYAALGLPYSSQATGQAQAQQAPGPGQTAGAQNAQAQQQQQLSQQMRPINALGKARKADFIPRVSVSTVTSLPTLYSLFSLVDFCLYVCIDWLINTQHTLLQGS